jgi:hypothetical protein
VLHEYLRFENGRILIESIKEHESLLKSYYEFNGLTNRQTKDLKIIHYVLSCLYDNQKTITQALFNQLVKNVKICEKKK